MGVFAKMIGVTDKLIETPNAHAQGGI